MSEPLSAHFTLADLTRTGTGLPNTPDTEARANLQALATELLEPIRVKAGNPVVVESAFRTEQVNEAVGGGPESPHLQGNAADFGPEEPEDYALLWLAVLEVAQTASTLDTAIAYEDRHHVHIVRAAEGASGTLLVQPASGEPVPWASYDGPLADDIAALGGVPATEPDEPDEPRVGCLGRVAGVLAGSAATRIGAVIAGVLVGLAFACLAEENEQAVAEAALNLTGVADVCRDVLPQCQSAAPSGTGGSTDTDEPDTDAPDTDEPDTDGSPDTDERDTDGSPDTDVAGGP